VPLASPVTLRRTALRRKSKKKRKWENWTLNRRYADAHPFDPIAQHFPDLPAYQTASEVHHITGGILGTPRWDIDANLIHLCHVTHKWAERYTHDGMAICLVAKRAMKEFDAEELNRIFHHDVINWLDGQRFEFEWAQKLFRNEFRKALGESKS